MRTRTRHTAIFTLALAILGAICSPARAQANALTDDIITSPTLNPQQVSTLEGFVNANLERLQSTDPAARQAGRDALLASLTRAGQQPSKGFRLALNRALGPRLKGLAGSPDVGVSLCALQIAGAAAAENGVDALLEGLGNERAAVRYAAASGLRSTLIVETAGGSVVPANMLDTAIDRMSQALAQEKDILVADAIVLALTSVPERTPLSARLMTVMASAMAKQVATRRVAGDAERRTQEIVLRAVLIARDSLTRRLPANDVDSAAAIAFAELGGHTLGYALVLIEQAVDAGGKLGADGLVDDLAIASEAVLVFSHQALTRQPAPAVVEETVSAAMQGVAKPFRDAVMSWIGPRGRLAAAPYRLDSAALTRGLKGN